MLESAIDVLVDAPAVTSLPYWQMMTRVGVPAHATILWPWRQAPLQADDLDSLRQITGTIGPFQIELVGVATFDKGVVYAEVGQSAELQNLMESVWAAFPDTPPYRGEFTSPPPHVTLAKCAPDALDEMRRQMSVQMADAFPITVDVSNLAVEEQQDATHWAVTKVLPLGAT